MNKKIDEIALTEKERKFLYLCLKSKNNFSLRKIVIKERMLDKLISIFSK